MRLFPLAVALAIAATACAEVGSDVGSPPSPDPTPTTGAPPASTTPSVPIDLEGPSALLNPAHSDLPTPLVDPAEIIHGGPPPDGIPAIDEPRFVSVGEADEWLGDEEAVVYLNLGGETHVYPVQILIWHEIVNDVVGGTPVAVTYCPLCNSAVSYERAIGEHVTTFGTSGRLYASALVMYDRLTESLWTHYDGRAVAGVLTGHELNAIPSPLLSWADLKRSFPDALVVDRDATGHDRRYGTNPYVGYDDPEGYPFLFTGNPDDRLRAMRRVVGVELDGDAKAWTLESISGGSVTATHGFVGGEEIVILWKAGQASALDGGSVTSGRDVGSAAVFSPVVGEMSLTFVTEGGSFVDLETGSEWDIAGRAVAGPLVGMTLDAIHHLDTFWFAWATYRPGTELVEE